MKISPPIALIAGVGPGLGRALCEQLLTSGYRVAGLARGSATNKDLTRANPERYLGLMADVTDSAQLDAAVAQVESRWGHVTAYVHNAAPFHRQPFSETPVRAFELVWRTMCLGAVQGVQRVLPGMRTSGGGALLFIGATASVKAGAQFAAFGSAKFALRGLAQALARELGPEGIHVAHLVIDGVMWSDRARDAFGMTREQCLDPESVARTCVHLLGQERSAWTHELDIRPDREVF
jgi:NAD(P)-dependent dehydrogenase (short-subunit alcohol dehydrogenase family)